MVRVRKRPLALQDLDEIWLTIATDRPMAADGVIDEIERVASLYATQPYMGRARDEIAAGIRSFSVSRYVVFYFPLDDGVEVVRVLDAARDIPAFADKGEFLE